MFLNQQIWCTPIDKGSIIFLPLIFEKSNFGFFFWCQLLIYYFMTWTQNDIMKSVIIVGYDNRLLLFQ